ncbi:uncharacterized protein ACA1_231420 [Acanthamoeba castellanii str. Neff]|uniref:Uncharacterized protein n=1 Tax=Acanthamoeba castellanii (strain ATCC 30010 / Neff) TaxID=1257118 RepID=L8H939_ACACF|nr:uncharacterized protein ACA1_231420 [Acanthamoeba castellanii str. Neff]ELR21685.1 hypothetical protein ACA1_231420 [Acanthamoeba castellanii str. Neff]
MKETLCHLCGHMLGTPCILRQKGTLHTMVKRKKVGVISTNIFPMSMSVSALMVIGGISLQVVTHGLNAYVQISL